MAFPTPDKDISLNSWIDTLDSPQILSLLNLWAGKTSFEDLPELISYLKTKFRNSNTIKQYFDESIKKAKEQAIFDNLIITGPPAKRYRFTTNCGASQCEFRFRGCDHTP